MAQVIPVFGGPVQEDLLGFITRVGVVTIEDVSKRFRWSYSKARSELIKLRASGVIESQKEVASYRRGGAIYLRFALKGHFAYVPPDPPSPVPPSPPPAASAALRRA